MHRRRQLTINQVNGKLDVRHPNPNPNGNPSMQSRIECVRVRRRCAAISICARHKRWILCASSVGHACQLVAYFENGNEHFNSLRTCEFVCTACSALWSALRAMQSNSKLIECRDEWNRERKRTSNSRGKINKQTTNATKTKQVELNAKRFSRSHFVFR